MKNSPPYASTPHKHFTKTESVSNSAKYRSKVVWAIVETLIFLQAVGVSAGSRHGRVEIVHHGTNTTNVTAQTGTITSLPCDSNVKKEKVSRLL